MFINWVNKLTITLFSVFFKTILKIVLPW